MKLLLTSSGITNTSLATALREMVAVPFQEAVIVFIPTAANVEYGDKGWMIDDLTNLRELKPKALDIVDISAVPRDVWYSRIEKANVIVVGGGNVFHLIHHIRKSGLAEVLPDLLKTMVCVGISAGSMVAGILLSVDQVHRLYAKDIGEYQGEKGLGLVNFYIRPHLNSPDFPKIREEYLKELAKELPHPLYAIDDSSAVRYIDGRVDVVSEGKWVRYN